MKDAGTAIAERKERSDGNRMRVVIRMMQQSRRFTSPLLTFIVTLILPFLTLTLKYANGSSPPSCTIESPPYGTVIGGLDWVEVELEVRIDDEETGAGSLDVKFEYYDGSAWRVAMDWTPSTREDESEGFDPYGTGGYCYKASLDDTFQFYYLVINDYRIGRVLDYKLRVSARDPSGLVSSSTSGNLVKLDGYAPVVKFNHPTEGAIIGVRDWIKLELDLMISDQEYAPRDLDLKLLYYDGSCWRTAMDWTPASEEKETEGFDPHGTGGECYKAPIEGNFQYYRFLIEDYFITEVTDYQFTLLAREPSGLIGGGRTGNLIKEGPGDILVGQWHFDENVEEEEYAADSHTVGLWHLNNGAGTIAEDSSGFGHDGFLNAGAVWTETGRFEKAILFNGQSSCVSIPHHDDLNLAEQFTVEAWVKPDDSSDSRVILNKGNAYMMRIDSQNEGGRVFFFI
jgi:hypothetical protein